MVLFPEGFVIPGVPYLGGLVLGAILTTILLVSLEPEVNKNYVVSFLPWMALGGILHGFYQVPEPPGLYPSGIAPIFSAPTVYLTMYVLVSVIWLILLLFGTATGHLDDIGHYLGSVGTGMLIVAIGTMIWQGLALGAWLLWPVVGFVASLVLTAFVYIPMSLIWTGPVSKTGVAGPALVFAQAFDGIITAIGYDILGAGEQMPVSAAILKLGSQLPVAEYIGAGWLFVVVKILIPVLVVLSLADYMAEQPRQGTLIFVMVTAVGLGPAMNNFVIFVLG